MLTLRRSTLADWFRFGNSAGSDQTRIERSTERPRDIRRTHFIDLQTATRRLEQTNRLFADREERLQDWKLRNPNFQSLGATDIVGHGVWLLSLAAAVVVDNMLLADAGREITRSYATVLGGAGAISGWPALLTSSLFALCYIVFEVAAGYRVSRKSVNGKTSILSVVLAVFLWLTLPVIIIGLLLSNSGLLTADPTQVIGYSTYVAKIFTIGGMGLLAIVTHGFLVLNGSHIFAAVSYLFYFSRLLHLERPQSRLLSKSEPQTAAAEIAFRDFHEDITGGAAGPTNPDGVPVVIAGPIGTMTRRVLNDVFGQEVVEEPRNLSPHDTRQQNNSEQAGEGPVEVDAAADRGVIGPVPNAPRYVYNTDGEDEVRR